MTDQVYEAAGIANWALTSFRDKLTRTKVEFKTQTGLEPNKVYVTQYLECCLEAYSWAVFHRPYNLRENPKLLGARAILDADEFRWVHSTSEQPM